MTSSRLLAVFWSVSVAHLTALYTGSLWLEQLSKPATMLLLAAYAAALKGPRLLLVALVLSCGGDTLLQFGDHAHIFMTGMACFAAAHVCLVVLFLKLPGLRPAHHLMRLAAGFYAAVWLVLVTLLWQDLEDLQTPVAVYSLLLSATAVTATRLGPVASLGGALFFASDALIAARLANWPQLPQAGLWIMVTYLAAQFLLTRTVLVHQHRNKQAVG